MEGEVHDEDIERLANRLALLVSEDGEADNAGRAVGNLARRLGLTGGKLKEVFLTGAAAALAVGLGSRRSTNATHEIERLEREITGLRQSLRMLDRSFRTTLGDNDALTAETDRLRGELDRGRSFRLMGYVVAIVVSAAVAGGLAFVLVDANMEERLSPEPQVVPQAELPRGGQTAVVRPEGAELRTQPDLKQAPSAFVTATTRLTVRRLLWNNLVQWAEVDFDGRSGYIAVTDLQLP